MHYTLKPGETIEAPFALPKKPELQDPLPLHIFDESGDIQGQTSNIAPQKSK